jgi:hypothetical protein
MYRYYVPILKVCIIEYPTKKTIQCSEAGAKKLPADAPPADNAAV